MLLVKPFEIRLVREMKKDIGKFHVSVDDTK